MVNRIKEIISEYQRRLVEMPFVPKRSYGHSVVGINGCVNAGFLTFLFSDKDLGFQFLKDAGLICSKVPCNTWSRDMTRCADPTTRCWCQRKVAEAKCSQSKAIRHGSWFQQSPHLPGGTVPHIRHRAARTCPPNPRRAWPQFRNGHGLGHVLQRDNAGVYGGLLWKDRRSYQDRWNRRQRVRSAKIQ